MPNVLGVLRAEFPAARTRAYLVGLALASPFFSDLLSRRVGFALLLPLLAHLLICGVRTTPAFRFPLFMVPLAFVAAIHALCLALPEARGVFPGEVIKDLAFFVALSGLCLAAHDASAKHVFRGFTRAIVALAFVVALLGLAKYALQERGILIEEVALLNGGVYPTGTSLRVDYNIYAMLMLVAAVAIVSRGMSHGWRWYHYVMLTTILSAGLLTGSRRFILLLPLLLVYWVFLIARSLPATANLARVAGVAGTVALICWALPVPFAIRDGKTVTAVQHEVISLIDDKPATPDDQMSADLNERTSLIEAPPSVRVDVIANTILGDHGYGLGSRADRWQLAKALTKNGPLIGTGFAYHEAYSCEFVKCQHIDYPHAPIVSAWLMGGIVAALLAASFYVLLLWHVWQHGRVGLTSGVSAIVLAVLPFALISGDTVLSMAHPIASGLLLTVQPISNDLAAERNRADEQH
jgi:hypothetical protein